MHARTPPQRRDGRQGGAIDPRPGRVASRPGRPLVAAIARSGAGPIATRARARASVDGRPQDLTHSGELEELVKEPAAYLIEYNDGLRATLLMLNGAVQDYTFACRLRGPARDRLDAVPAAAAAERGLFGLL